VATTKGSSLVGLLAGLLDGDSTADLAAAIRDALAFATEDHRYDIVVRIRHNSEDGDS